MTLRRAASWWLMVFVVLTLVYTTGVLHSSALPRLLGEYPTAPVNRAPNFDGVSEALIKNRIEMRFAGLETGKPEFLFTVRNGKGPDPRNFDIARPDLYDPGWKPGRVDLQAREHYRSQIGLQGRSYAAASNALRLDRARTFMTLRIFSISMLAAMLAALVTWLASVWGRAAGFAAFIFCIFATGFNLFAPQLYWVTFVHVAPTVVAACLAARLPQRGVPAHVAAFVAILLVFVAKFASGYEFMTVTIAAAAVPFFVAYATARITIRMLMVYAAAMVAIGMLAFGLTIGVHDMLYRQAFGQSGLAFLQVRSQSSSGLPFSGLLGTPLQMGKLGIVNSADIAGYGIPNFVALAAGLPFAWIAARALFRREMGDERNRIALAVTAALLASTSWLLLQYPHVSFHPRYTTILVAFPYGLVLAAALGRLWHLHLRESNDHASPSKENAT